MTEYCEKTFATTILLDTFRKLALRTCKLPHWVELEGRDRSKAPNTLFIIVVFCGPEERDRFMIALRYAEEERAELAKAPPVAAKPRPTTVGSYATA